MKWKLDVIVIPVSDVEVSKDFYANKVGFGIDIDEYLNNGVHLVQLTPKGSNCSVTLGSENGLSQMPAGSLKGLQLVVSDIEKAHEELTDRGVNVSPIRHVDENGEWQDGKGGTWNSFLFFDDPDGNSWAIQESGKKKTSNDDSETSSEDINKN